MVSLFQTVSEWLTGSVGGFYLRAKIRQDLADILEEGPSARSTTIPTRSFSKVAEWRRWYAGVMGGAGHNKVPCDLGWLAFRMVKIYSASEMSFEWLHYRPLVFSWEAREAPCARSDRQNMVPFSGWFQQRLRNANIEESLLKVSVGIVRSRWQKSGVRLHPYQEPVKRRRYPEPEHCAQIIHFGSQRQDGALPGRKCRLCTSWSGWEEFERRWCRVFQRRSAVPQGFQGVIESFLLQFFANRMSFLCRVLFLQDFIRTLLRLPSFCLCQEKHRTISMSSYGKEKSRRSSAILDRAVSKGNLSEVFRLGLKMGKRTGWWQLKVFYFHPWGRWTHFDLRIFFLDKFFFHSRSCWLSDPPGVTRVSGVTRLREQELTATLSARNSNRADNERSRISAQYVRNPVVPFFFCLTAKMMKELFKMVVHVSVGGDSKELHNDLDMSLIFLLLVGNKWSRVLPAWRLIRRMLRQFLWQVTRLPSCRKWPMKMVWRPMMIKTRRRTHEDGTAIWFWGSFLLGKSRDEAKAKQKPSNFPVQNNQISSRCFFLGYRVSISVVALQFCQPFCIWLCVQSLGSCASIWRHESCWVETQAGFLGGQMVDWADASVENWDSRCCHHTPEI